MDPDAQQLLDHVRKYKRNTSFYLSSTRSVLIPQGYLTPVEIHANIRKAQDAAISANTRLTPAILALERITAMSNHAEANLEAVRSAGGDDAAVTAAQENFLRIDGVKNGIETLTDQIREDIHSSIENTIEFICIHTNCRDLRDRTAAVDENLPRKLQILREFIDSLPPPVAAAMALEAVPPAAAAAVPATPSRRPGSAVVRSSSLQSAQRYSKVVTVRELLGKGLESQGIDDGSIGADEEDEFIREGSIQVISDVRKNITQRAVSGLLANAAVVSRRASGAAAPAAAASAAAASAAAAVPVVPDGLLLSTFPLDKYDTAAAPVHIEGGFEILSRGPVEDDDDAHKRFCEVFFFNACLSFLDPHSHDPVFPLATNSSLLDANLDGYRNWFNASECDFSKFKKTVTNDDGGTYCDARAKKVVAALASELRVKLGIDIEDITEDITTDQGLQAFTAAFRTFAGGTQVRLVVDSIAGGTRFEQFVLRNSDLLFMRYGPHERSDPGPARVTGLPNLPDGATAYFPSWALTFGNQTMGTLRIDGDYVIKDYNTIYGHITLRLLKGGRGASNAEMGKFAECFSSRQYDSALAELNKAGVSLGTTIEMCDGFTLTRNREGNDYTIASRDGKYQITFENSVAGQHPGIVSAICCDAKHQGDYGKQVVACNADGDSDGDGLIKRLLVTVEKLGKEAVSVLANQFGGTIHLLQNGQATLCTREGGGVVAIPSPEERTELLRNILGILPTPPHTLFEGGARSRLNSQGKGIVQNARRYAMGFLRPLVTDFETSMGASKAENKARAASLAAGRVTAAAASGSAAPAAAASSSDSYAGLPPFPAVRRGRAVAGSFSNEFMQHELYTLITEYTQADAGVTAGVNLSLNKTFSDPFALLRESPKAFAGIKRLYADQESYYKPLAGIDIDELCRKLRIVGGSQDDFVSSKINFEKFFYKNIHVFDELFGSGDPLTRDEALKQRACSDDIALAIAFFYMSLTDEIRVNKPILEEDEDEDEDAGEGEDAGEAAAAAADAGEDEDAAAAAAADAGEDEDAAYDPEYDINNSLMSATTESLPPTPRHKKTNDSNSILNVLQYAQSEITRNHGSDSPKLYARKRAIMALLGTITIEETGLYDGGGGGAARRRDDGQGGAAALSARAAPASAASASSARAAPAAPPASARAVPAASAAPTILDQRFTLLRGMTDEQRIAFLQAERVEDLGGSRRKKVRGASSSTRRQQRQRQRQQKKLLTQKRQKRQKPHVTTEIVPYQP